MDVLTSVDPTSSQPSSADPFHPSFFELAAQSQLQELIKPAVRYVLAVLAQRNPRYLLRVVNSFDEVYALAMAGIETHYLRVWGSSFAENFYGLRRRKRPGLSRSAGAATSVSMARSERLGQREIRLSLLFLVALPYVGAKLEDVWERNGGGLSNSAGLFDDDPSSTAAGRFNDTAVPLREKLQKGAMEAFKTAFPYAKTAWQLWLLTYNVCYLFDKTPYWRPWFGAMRIDVRRVGPNDGPRKPLLPHKMPSLVRQPAKFFATVLRLAPGTLFEALKYGLPASIFFFKFLEWWYGADNPRRRRPNPSSSTEEPPAALDPPAPLLPDLANGLLAPNTPADTPPYTPPHIFALSSSLLDSPHAKPALLDTKRKLVHNSCPLCGALPINNPAVLPSGYVFCYTCAFEFVERHGRCPVTSVDVPERKDALRKVLG
ncbi:related to Peroxisome assembly protein 12 [Sporisorium reilianum SRZ2]|uniref:Peroxisome assembly protein 12 n=1 Tax=Sporisorium reilianum (strain SRZ2) TaxID=999809 RepID=E6ZK46_SPORE|nr:related to Peroxisome assembly protein 12 [Sporisorium reilianum SRZ2]